jgi:hypothetical protein
VRQWLAGTFAVLVLAAVVGGGVWLLMQRTELDPADEVTPVAEAYAEAWAAWDVDAMAALLADEPADFGPQHTSMVESLAPTGTRITLGEPTLLRAQASFETTVALDLPTGDTWSYITTVVLQRLDGDWQVVWTPATLHPDLRARWRIAAEVEDAFRAPIVDREGRPLSADGDTVTVGVQPSRLGDGVRALQTLRRVLPEAARPLEELLERDDLQPDWFYPLVTIRAEQAAEVRSDLLGLPGVLTRTEEGRVGSDDGFALHTLGRLETVEGLGGQPVEVGAYGLEAAFEDQLTGSAALRVQLLDPEGDLRDTLFTAQDDAPEPLVTTLDLDVQRAIENTLVGLDQPASIVAVDPGTGGILGVAHRPLTGYPRGLEGRFAPGATFGLVTLAALVDAGVGLDAPADCPQTTTVGGVRVEASAAEPDLPEVATVTDAVATANSRTASSRRPPRPSGSTSPGSCRSTRSPPASRRRRTSPSGRPRPSGRPAWRRAWSTSRPWRPPRSAGPGGHPACWSPTSPARRRARSAAGSPWRCAPCSRRAGAAPASPSRASCSPASPAPHGCRAAGWTRPTPGSPVPRPAARATSTSPSRCWWRRAAAARTPPRRWPAGSCANSTGSRPAADRQGRHHPSGRRLGVRTTCDATCDATTAPRPEALTWPAPSDSPATPTPTPC